MPIIFDEKGNKNAVSCKDCKYYLKIQDECVIFDIKDILCTHFVKSETAGNKKYYVKLGGTSNND